MVQPPRDHPVEQRLPSLGGLVGENHGADTVLAEHAAAFGEGVAHRVLEERSVLDATAARLGLVLHRLAGLGRERVVSIELVAQQRMVRQRPFEPDKEEIGEVRVGNGVVIRRVGKPDTGGSVGQRMIRGIGRLNLASR